ncbi:MAG TPA: PfkB family carbohydrate kinase [Fimbriiglobus sp.]|nr:PfkB family carbohydrate kinase [Fimbriiglobus sp.]
MLTTDLIEHILATIPTKTVGLLGDLFLDRYLDIDPALDELSVETGLTAYQVARVRSYPGALGTVLNNLAALGVGRIVPIAVIGDDGEGYELRQALGRMPAVELGGLVIAAGRRTPTYTKPMRGTEELNRLDIKNRTPTPAALEDAVLKRLDEAWPRLDALIVLDQVSEEDCGVVTRRIRDRLAVVANGDPAKFVLADSRERIWNFWNVSVKPNERECHGLREWGGATLTEEELDYQVWQQLNRIGRPIFVTEGKLGIKLFTTCTGGWQTRRALAYPVSGPIDIVGAGDSCSAGITCAMASGATHEQAAAFGNLVASITIQQIGTTGAAFPEQVRQRWREVQPGERGA